MFLSVLAQGIVVVLFVSWSIMVRVGLSDVGVPGKFLCSTGHAVTAVTTRSVPQHWAWLSGAVFLFLTMHSILQYKVLWKPGFYSSPAV